MEEQYVPIRTPPALVEWKRVVNDAYLLLADIREDAAWQMGVNEWLQHALSLAERVKATPVEEPPSSPSRERVEVLEEALREIAKQELSPDMSVDDQLDGDFEGAYNRMIEVARAALGEKADRKLGELVAIARECRGWTLRDLERETGVSNAMISQIETGKIKSPSFETVVRLSRALGVSMERFAACVIDLQSLVQRGRRDG